MRGKEAACKLCTVGGGITPAYAGKSPKSRPASGPERDHPRVCGEKFDNPKIVYSEKGSPPRMRGKAVTEEKGEEVQGDHPRVCGEKT